MSYVDKTLLKGNLDQTIQFFTTDQAFTTAVITIDAKTMFNAFIKTFRIVNNDANPLTYVQGQVSGVVKTVPPKSEVLVDGWESLLIITPNAVSGVGFVELDLVNFVDVYRK